MSKLDSLPEKCANTYYVNQGVCDDASVPSKPGYHWFMVTKLDPLVSEHATLEDKEAYEAWARERIRKSRADPRPYRSAEEVWARVFAMLEEKSRKRNGN
jgi:hypothetical protein